MLIEKKFNMQEGLIYIHEIFRRMLKLKNICDIIISGY